MSKTYETGYAKNVANFETLVSQVQSLGEAYMPSRTSIQLPNLLNQLEKAKTALNQLHVLLAKQKDAIYNRNAAFEPLKKLNTRVLSAAKALDISTQQIDGLKGQNRKLQGKRSGVKETSLSSDGGEVPVKHHSNSQQSYDSLLDHFDQFIQQLKVIPGYQPNEPELKTEQLTSLLAELLGKNSEVIYTSTAITNSRMKRDEIMFQENEGLGDLAAAVKNYVKSLYGATSPVFKQFSKILIKNT